MKDMSYWGRGKKLPYKTKIIRVPVPIANEIQEIVDAYRNDAIRRIDMDKPDRLNYNFVTEGQLIRIIQIVLKHKKSARDSLILLANKILPHNHITVDDIKKV